MNPIKLTLATGLMALVAGLAGPALADEPRRLDWEYDPTPYRLGALASSFDGMGDESDAERCLEVAATLVKNGDKTPIAVRATPYLTAGTYGVAEVQAACTKAYRDAIVTMLVAIGDGLPERIAEVDSGQKAYLDDLRVAARACGEYADKALALGAPATTPITIKAMSWTGQLGDVKTKVCTSGDDAMKRYNERVLGPYAKVLKADKYAWVADTYPSEFFVPALKGASTLDPKQLAKATVWFRITEREPTDDDHCARDKVYFYRRLQFDKKHKLVKDTEKTYCGDPGKKALR